MKQASQLMFAVSVPVVCLVMVLVLDWMEDTLDRAVGRPESATEPGEVAEPTESPGLAGAAFADALPLALSDI